MTLANNPDQPHWARQRLDEIKAGPDTVPLLVETLKLGLLDDWSPGHVVKNWQPSKEVAHADGTMFGGYIAALADQMLSFAAMSVVPADKAFRTINLAVNFFKVCPLQPLVIEAEVVAHTKRLISVEVTFAKKDGTLMAKATGQQAILPLPAPIANDFKGSDPLK